MVHVVEDQNPVPDKYPTYFNNMYVEYLVHVLSQLSVVFSITILMSSGKYSLYTESKPGIFEHC